MKSVHLFVNLCEESLGRLIGQVFDGQLTSVDRVPQKYLFERNFGFECSEPLYISNQMVILSPNVKQQKFPIEDIFKAFDRFVWYLIIVSLFVIIITNKLSFDINSVNKKFQRLSDVFWIHFKPIIGIAENLGFQNQIYILWVFAMIPITAIIRNELLTNLLTKHLKYADTIEDLLDNGLTVYTDHYKIGDWANIKFTKDVQDFDFKEKLSKLTNKLQALEKDAMSLVEYLNDPAALLQLIYRSVMVQDEEWIKVLEPFFSKLVSTHIGEGYLPQLITPLCYGHNFSFIFEANLL